jgi:hypothetical protein
MFRKTLLLGAALTVAAIAAVQAQTPVYSVNVVGYHKVVIPHGFTMIANQVNGTNNTVAALFQTPPLGTTIYKFAGASFQSFQYDDFGSPIGITWFPNGNATLNPGEGAFVYNPSSAYTNTFAGEVLVGSITNNLPAGFTIRSSGLPQGGALGSALNFPAAQGDTIYRFNGSSYNSFSYDFVPPTFTTLGWFPSEPSLGVGESFFVFKTSNTDWVRVFSVGP